MQGRYRDHRGRRLVGLATVFAVLPVAAWAHTVGIEGDDALARGVHMSVLFLRSMRVAVVGVIFGTVDLAQRGGESQGRPGLAGPQHAPAPRKAYRHVLQV